MADVFDTKKRSEIMKRVCSSRNKTTEMKLIELLKKYNIHGWRRNYPVKGHPDFVYLNKRIALFVDGCFWYGHDCQNTHPKNNEAYWIKKLEHNRRHDSEITEYFQKRGWTVIRIWECELKANAPLSKLINYL